MKGQPIYQDHARICGEPPLSWQPDVFQAIFGDCEYPPSAVKKLMAAVVLLEVKDYFTNPEKFKCPEARTRAAKLRAEAENYLFEPDFRPANPIFSFDLICKTLDVDPGYARRGIRQRTAEEIREIVQRMSYHKQEEFTD
jgi:hypothetical protein